MTMHLVHIEECKYSSNRILYYTNGHWFNHWTLTSPSNGWSDIGRFTGLAWSESLILPAGITTAMACSLDDEL